MRFRIKAVISLLLASTAAGFQLPIVVAPGSRTTLLGRRQQERAIFFSSTGSSSSSTVTVEHLEDSAVLVHIPVPGKATQAAYDKVCADLSKKIQIPGFRKGSRIPPQVLEQSMAAKGGRNALKVQTIKELVTQLVEPTMKEQALDPIGQLTLKVSPEDLAETFVPGQDLMLDVQCDVWPEIKWKRRGNNNNGGDDNKPYVGLKASYQRKPFNQAKLDKATLDLRERYATLVPIEDPAHALQMGDACTVNMVGYMADANGNKGEPLPNAASGDRVQVLMGKGLYMEGLVEGLVGAKPGDTVTVSVQFPNKLRDKTLAGKRAIFDVEVLDASKRIVPDISDELAAKVRPGSTKETLLEELRKAVDQEDAKEFTPARNQALGKALAQVLEVVVPDTLVTNQARERFATMMAEMRDGGVSDDEIKKQINPENFLKYKNIVKDDIISDFKVSMATDEIARLEGITVPTYQVEEQMEAIRKDATESKEEFDEAMIRGKVETTLTRQAVYDWLAEKAQLEVQYLKEEPVFDEKLMEQLAQESLQREQQGKPAVVGQNEKMMVDAMITDQKKEEESLPETTTEIVETQVENVVDATMASAADDVSVTMEDKDSHHPVVAVIQEDAVVEESITESVVSVVEQEKIVPTTKIDEATMTVQEAAVVEESTITEPVPVEPAKIVSTTIDEATMTVQERAFSALLNAGVIAINKSPNDPVYDHSKDSEVADGTIYKE